MPGFCLANPAAAQQRTLVLVAEILVGTLPAVKQRLPVEHWP